MDPKKTESEEVIIKKVKGISNPADMMTKAINKEKPDKYMMMTKQTVVEGRAKEALQWKREEKLKANKEMKVRERNAIADDTGE